MRHESSRACADLEAVELDVLGTEVHRLGRSGVRTVTANVAEVRTSRFGLGLVEFDLVEVSGPAVGSFAASEGSRWVVSTPSAPVP